MIYLCSKNRIIRRFLEHIIYSNLVVSLSIGMLCWGICHQLHITKDEIYGIFVFASTLLTYNIQRLIKANQQRQTPTNQVNWISAHKNWIYFLLLISGFTTAYYFFQLFQLRIEILFILGASSLMSLLYVFKIKQISLREIPYLKIHIIAFVCIVAIGVVELLNEHIFQLSKWGFVFIHYIYFLAITIPFDIRDVKFDSPKLKTIPQVFGVRKAVAISVFLYVLFLLYFVLFKTDIFKNPFFDASVLFTFLLLIKTNQTRKEFYFSGIIEASIFVMGMSYVIT